MAALRLAVLQTGGPPAGLERFGSYGGMVGRMLGPGYACETFDVPAGALPQEPFDAALVTGSSAGVYDDLPWIAPLKDWLAAARGRTRLVGICFGHQVMAEAFGGQVEKSAKGWGVGLARYDVRERAPWMDAADSLSLAVSHQDQVVAPPPGAQVLAGSDFTPYGVLAYGEDAVSFQQHPEFSPDYVAALVERRRGSRFSEAQADAALASLAQPDDRPRAAGWIDRFLRR